MILTDWRTPAAVIGLAITEGVPATDVVDVVVVVVVVVVGVVVVVVVVAVGVIVACRYGLQHIDRELNPGGPLTKSSYAVRCEAAVP